MTANIITKIEIDFQEKEYRVWGFPTDDKNGEDVLQTESFSDVACDSLPGEETIAAIKEEIFTHIKPHYDEYVWEEF